MLFTIILTADDKDEIDAARDERLTFCLNVLDRPAYRGELRPDLSREYSVRYDIAASISAAIGKSKAVNSLSAGLRVKLAEFVGTVRQHDYLRMSMD